ncbi:hypothetical protein BJX96DRAFT_175497 [Aspergillus floccosus]
MTNSLSAATCAIYAVLAIPVLYLLVRHGRYGLLGWLFLFFFCTLRIIGSALVINDTSVAANIISSVGLSPLLLATAGILHEARRYRIQPIDKKMEWVFVLAYHMLVVAGVALTAAGSAKLQEHEQPFDKAERMAKLLTAVAVSLIFIGIRVFYSVAALCTQRASLNPITGSLAIRVVLGFLPEVIATLVYLFAGIGTQSAAPLARDEEMVSVLPKRRAQPWV